jgi:hypothetical protein
MLHKMTGGNPNEFPEAPLPLLEITDEDKQIELTKELMDFVNRAFAAQNQRLDEETWNEALHPIFKGKERTMIKTIFEEREEIGEVKASREIILESIRERFGKVPKSIERAINQMHDPIALKSLAVRTASCTTLAEFEAEL